MNIFVCLKQVPDTASRIQLLPDANGIDETHLEWIINPYDEFALEAALQIKEKHKGQVNVLSLGPKRVENALRRALAMGADQAYLVECGETQDPSLISLACAEVIQTISSADSGSAGSAGFLPDLILMGKTSVDFNHSATGPMLAEHLNLPHIGFVTCIKNIADTKESKITVERPLNEAKETITTGLPLLLTVEKGINQPRYPSLPGIIQAKKKPLKIIPLSSLKAQNHQSSIQFRSYQLPQSPKAQILSGTSEQQVKQLVQILRDKEKVL